MAKYTDKVGVRVGKEEQQILARIMAHGGPKKRSEAIRKIIREYYSGRLKLPEQYEKKLAELEGKGYGSRYDLIIRAFYAGLPQVLDEIDAVKLKKKRALKKDKQ
jgi:hypothetical protein